MRVPTTSCRVFATLSDRLTATFKNLRGKGRLESDVNKAIRDIRLALLDADVALPVVKRFTHAVRERALGEEVSQALNPAQQVVKIVNEELVAILGGETRQIRFAKTLRRSSCSRACRASARRRSRAVRRWLKDRGHTPLLVAADLQRPNAVTRSSRSSVSGPVSRSSRRSAATSAATTRSLSRGRGRALRRPGDRIAGRVEHARAQQHDVVIVDTAGRLAVDANLMQQAADIREAIQPDEVLFVIDAMIGQAAVETAQAFHEGVAFTGVVLSCSTATRAVAPPCRSAR